MEKSTIALIIMVVTIALYAWDKLPMYVTSILAALAMALTGCIPYASALAGFSNTATLMVIALCIIGEAFFTTGLATQVGHVFLSIKSMDEKKFIILAFLAGSIISALLNGLIVIAIFLPVIDSLAARTNGKISRKNTYLPVGLGALFGGNLSAIGSSSMINASAQLGTSYFGRTFNLFEPFMIGLPGVIITLIIFIITGTKLQKKFFDFDDAAASEHTEIPHPMHPLSKSVAEKDMAMAANDTNTKMTWKMWTVLLVLVGCIVAFACNLHFGVFSFVGAFILIVLNCIDAKHALKSVSWDTVFVVAGTLGFAEGVRASGAGQVIADTMLKVCGPLSNSPFAMCVVLLFLGTVISNFMSNNATVAILVPISLLLAQGFGVTPVPFVLACAVGANLSCMTPICTATITMTASCGYRFKDFFRYGGIFNLLSFIGTAVALKLVYFM